VVNKRLERAKKEIAYASNYDYIIVNDNLKDAVEGLRSIIKAEKLKLKRNRMCFVSLNTTDDFDAELTVHIMLN